METKFQSSFIPRRPIPATPGSLAPQVQRHVGGGGGSIFFVLGVIVFVLGIASVGGAYAWKAYLESSREEMQVSLAQRKKDLNTDQISVIKSQSSKIALAQQLINNHKSVSKIFSVVSRLTTESVRFTSMDLTIPVGTPGAFQLTLAGYGRNYPAVAFQSDVLNQLNKYGLGATVKNAIVSNPNLNHDGSVSFGFTAQIDPSSFAYTKAFAAPVTGSTTPQ